MFQDPNDPRNRNPFGLPAKPAGAPQLTGVQAPNVPMQDTPGMMETMAPTAFQHLVPDEAGKGAFDWIANKAKGTAALAKPGVTSELARQAAVTSGAVDGGLAAAASQAVPTAVAEGAAAATGAGKGAGGAALGALGPMAVPLLIGGALYAASR